MKRLPVILAAVLMTAAAPQIVSAQVVPPDGSYRRFETSHFRVIFPAGMEDFARYAAARAEWAYGALHDRFMEPPSGRIALVIGDGSDGPNASATPIPDNRIALTATPSIFSRQLSFYRDWLDIILAHELTHIFHLDRAGGLWRVPRAVFGRLPPLFPAFYQPRWVIEGLATYYESRLTGAGRVHGSYFDMLLRDAARRDGLRTVDAANGLSPTWPAGQTPYAYGALYFESLARQHGDSALGAFARSGSARVPYTVEWAATPVFGRSLSAGWDAWRERFTSRARKRVDSLVSVGLTEGRPLSGYGWVVFGPRYSPDGAKLAYSIFSARSDPATVIVATASGEEMTRSRRNGAGGSAWDGETLYFDQPERAGRFRIYRDIYSLEPRTGRQSRITSDARISNPDVAPGGSPIVATQIGEGTTRLILVDPSTGAIEPLTAFRDSVNWNRPRWSPDGRRIAAERWVRDGVLDIVVLSASGAIDTVLTDDPAVDVGPAWSPDGRFLLWSSDRTGVFNIHAADLSADGPDRSPQVWQVTNVTGAAFDPDVSPDGERLAFVAHHAEGFRVEELPFDPWSWSPASEASPMPAPPAATPAVGGAITGIRDYSPFPSLWPKAWLPVAATGNGSVGTLVGASTFGTDDLRRHTYGILAGWRSGVEDIEIAGVYLYRGLGNPTVRLDLSQDWSSFLVLDARGDTGEIVAREREVTLTTNFLWPTFRSAFFAAPAFQLESVRLSSPDLNVTDPTTTDLELSFAVGASTARGYPRSVSQERGLGAQLRLSHARHADDFDRSRSSAEMTVSGYLPLPLPGFANHVLAAQLRGGISSARGRASEVFFLGGTPGREFEVVPSLLIAGGADYPVRGFEEGAQRGDRIVSANLEYRFPLLLVGRGYKLWPVLVDRISGSVFLDAGSAWTDDQAASVNRTLVSTGAELSLDLGLGYSLLYRFRLGLARRLTAPGVASPGWSTYLAAGIAF